MGTSCTCSERNKKEYESVFKDYHPIEKKSNAKLFFDDVSFDMKSKSNEQDKAQIYKELAQFKQAHQQDDKINKKPKDYKVSQQRQKDKKDKGKGQPKPKISAQEILDYVLEDVKEQYKRKRSQMGSNDFGRCEGWKLSPRVNS
ncbi:unnamed protein product [Moneuplotes crassus]|uniref:Uncharacterized protein n=1 Tax=Euplotes crassus TaxID=5936 RepID=A0AAD1Y137_EUPCR|nr:unnamed protein product [Moneuplotes crassus]